MSTLVTKVYIGVIYCFITGLQAQTFEVCSEYNSRIIRCPELTFKNGIVCYSWGRSLVFGWLWSEAAFVCQSTFRLTSNHKLKCKYNRGMLSRHNHWYWDKGKPTCESTVSKVLMIRQMPDRKTSISSSTSTLVSSKLSSRTLMPVVSTKTALPSPPISSTMFEPASPSESPTSQETPEASSTINQKVFAGGNQTFLSLLYIAVIAAVAIVLTICVVAILICRRGRRRKIHLYKALFETESDDDDEYYKANYVTNQNYYGYAPNS